MNNGEECAKYFLSKREWKRCFELLRKKWEALGKTGGKIVLKDSTPQERQAIGRMMGSVYQESEVALALKDFEEMLQKTRFAPISLRELLEAYFGCEIHSNMDRKQEKEEKKRNFFESCRVYFENRDESEKEYILDWISAMEKMQSRGYAQVIREWQMDETQARKIVCTIGDALMEALKNTEDVPLAVFAAQISGNPHYLDRGYSSGRLFMQGLCLIQDKDYPQFSSEWKERLLSVHILPDDISSMVTTLGIHLQNGVKAHQAVEEFCRMREPVILTALNLRGATAAWTEEKRIYIVENEMVFTYLADKICEGQAALMCTSGQPRIAALEIIKLLVENNTEIYYSGDMDPEGMGIADRLWQKYPEKVHIWRMSGEDDKKAISNEEIDSRSMKMLNNLKNPELQNTARSLYQQKYAAYQENILIELCEDIQVIYYSTDS